MPDRDDSYRKYIEERLDQVARYREEDRALLHEILGEVKKTNGQVLVLKEQMPENAKERLARLEQQMSPATAAGISGVVTGAITGLAKLLGWL